jgi:predicted Zn-dependent peptidase
MKALLRSLRKPAGLITRPISFNLNSTLSSHQFEPSSLSRDSRVFDIPEALQYVRPVEITTLSNGIRVCSEYWKGPFATIGITIEAGSRNETFENMGTAHFLEHIHFKGTGKRSRIRLESEIENIGGNLNAYTSRETTLYQMQIFRESTDQAMDILSDMLLNSKYNISDINVEREVIIRESQEVDSDSREFVLEHVHNVAYKDHIVGQPILGTTDSIMKISQNDLKKFIYTHYIGPRIVVCSAGDISHSQLIDLAEKYLSKVKVSTEIPIVGETIDPMRGGLKSVVNESMNDTYLGLFYPAPSWKEEDYWAFLVISRLMGDFDPLKGGFLDVPQKEYSHIRNWAASMENLVKHEGLYLPYKDFGLIGHYAATSEKTGHETLIGLLRGAKILAEELNDEMVIRAKNKLYSELLQIETGSDVVQNLGAQFVYMGRRVPRSEIATRIAALDTAYLKEVFRKWVRSSEASIVIYGPNSVEESIYSSYKEYLGDI